MARPVLCLAVFLCCTLLQGMAKGTEMDQESCANGASKGHSLIQVKRIGAVPSAKLGLASLSTGGIGSTADLNEEGFNATVARCCTVEMAQFIRRFVEEKLMKTVCHVGGPIGMAHWYDCEDDNKTFADLKDNTNADSRAVTGPCAWIGDPADANGCSKRDDDCPEGTGTLPPCVPAVQCLDMGVEYKNEDDNDLDSTPASEAAVDELACQAACQGKTECTHFSFSTKDIRCTLKSYPDTVDVTSSTISISNPDVNSGPKTCDITPTTTETTTTSITPESCFQNVDYRGGTAATDTTGVNIEQTDEPTDEWECQRKCAQNPQCTHFTFRPYYFSPPSPTFPEGEPFSRGCWLKDFGDRDPSTNAALTNSNDPAIYGERISGPKEC